MHLRFVTILPVIPHAPTKKTLLRIIPKEDPCKKGDHKLFFDMICCAPVICHHSASHTSCSDKEDRATQNTKGRSLQARRDSIQVLSESITSFEPSCRAPVCCHIPPVTIFMFRQRRPCRAPSYARQTSPIRFLAKGQDEGHHIVHAQQHDVFCACDLSPFDH